MIAYKNFNSLKTGQPVLARELLDNVSEGGWMNEEIYYYDSLENFAYNELTEGWYAALDCGLGRQDFNGAPNPLDYIDLTELGTDLSNSWDDSCHFLSSQNQVLETSHGW